MILTMSEPHLVPCTVCDARGFLKVKITGDCLISEVHQRCPNCRDGIAYATEFEIGFRDARKYSGSKYKIWKELGILGDKIYARINGAN